MARLRDRERGCPWDLEQDFASIAPYTIEEAYEVADAIDRDDCDASEGRARRPAVAGRLPCADGRGAGRFDFGDVVAAICDKMSAGIRMCSATQRRSMRGADRRMGSASRARSAGAGDDDTCALAGIRAACRNGSAR